MNISYVTEKMSFASFLTPINSTLDCSYILFPQVSGMPLGTILLSLCTLIISNTFAIIIHWKLALVMIVFVPLILVGVYFEQKTINGGSDVKDTQLQKSAAVKTYHIMIFAICLIFFRLLWKLLEIYELLHL